MTRRTILEIIDPADEGNRGSEFYDACMIILIVLSIVPLAFKDTHPALDGIDRFCAVVFVIDYILRWATADLKFPTKSAIAAFLSYPFTPMAIIDLVSVLPSFLPLNEGFKILRIVRMLRALRVLRVLKAVRYSKSIRIIARVIENSKESLAAVCTLALGYILVSALIVFNAEPDSFETFFDAIYWATVSLTTVGYGDIYPVTTIGRLITMVSSVFGIAIVALPAGVITAGYMQALNEADSQSEQNQPPAD